MYTCAHASTFGSDDGVIKVHAVAIPQCNGQDKKKIVGKHGYLALEKSHPILVLMRREGEGADVKFSVLLHFF